MRLMNKNNMMIYILYMYIDAIVFIIMYICVYIPLMVLLLIHVYVYMSVYYVCCLHNSAI